MLKIATKNRKQKKKKFQSVGLNNSAWKLLGIATCDFNVKSK